MYILDKYISLKIIKGYLTILFAFIGLYVIVDLFSNLGSFLETKIPFNILVTYYFYSLLLIFLRVSPFSLLISTIYIFGRLNKSNEILGMRTFGLSALRISLVVLILSFVISSASLFIQERFLLTSQERVEEVKMKYIKKKKTFSQRRNITFRYQNMLFFVSRFIPYQRSLEEVIIFKEDNQGNITEKIVARKITYLKGIWVANEAISYKVNSQGKISDKPLYFKTKVIGLKEKPENLLIKRTALGEFLSLKDLKKEIHWLRKIKAYNILSNLTIQLHQKIVQPFSHFFLIIGALPFVLEIKKRKVALSSLGLGFIFSFLYYLIFSVSLALGKAGVLLPSLCAWTAPLFFLIAGISGLLLLR
ncbi:MAG: hypothetical protein DRP72_03475 [Candidatus Omnitrophota bacterium]|nr:MAG: hypothetical protein DRP72_03475 [Candidatus Omnitrophota bacterium]